MEVSSKHQMFVFVLCVISGIGCGILFDIQRSLRKISIAGKIRTTAEDTLFAMACTAVALILGFYFNRGQMRYYQVMGIISGALFYSAFLSRIVMKFLLFTYNFLGKILFRPFVKVIKAILHPVIDIFEILKKKSGKLKRVFHRVLHSISVKKKQLKKRMKML